MGLQGAFAEFGRLLDERLSVGALMTEDTIRYTFFFALTTSGGFKHTDLTMEYPHPHADLDGKKADTVISAAADRESAAFEFKYDRASPGASVRNRTQRAAKVLIDLFRLVKVSAEVATAKYLVYVTDAKMAGYFRNPANGLHELFELAEGTEHSVGPGAFDDFAPTLKKMVAAVAADCVVARVFATDLRADHCIRIFSVSAPRPGGTP